ncbi:MAG: RNAse [Marmoricola sp.]|nr:RNAse [Marmoricola sp.]
MLDSETPENNISETPADIPADLTVDTGEAAPAAKKPAKKSAAKKATAKKATKASAKKAAKSTESSSAEAPEDDTSAGGAPAQPRRRAAKKASAPPTSDGTDDEAQDGDAPARGAGAPMVLFQAPETTTPARKRAAKKAAAPAAEDDTTEDQSTEDGPAPAKKTSGRRPAKKAAAPAAADDEGDDAETDGQADGEDADGNDTGEGGARRRRRRGGRRRRRGAGEDAADGAEGEDAGESGEDESTDGEAQTRRTRTRVRQPRNPEDEITSIGGSTRLEAKKQRRREGREAGRRRAPIVSEAEFLARREAVDRVMVIRQRDDLTQIGVLEDKVLVEHYASRDSQTSLIGNIYLGRVQNVLPSMEAAFIDIGKGRNAVLYAGEVNWSALGHKDGQVRKVESVLKSGQTILVQVTKDPIGHKGARLTGQISLPGRFLVYVPDGNTSGISRKLPDTERNRLKTLLKEIVPNTAGVIVRTAAEGASEEELTQDVERLTARWAEIETAVAAGRSPELLYGEPDLTLKVVRDLFTEDFNSLVIDGSEAWDLVDGYVSQVAPDLRERLSRYDSEANGGRDVFAAYRVDEQIAKGLDRKVWLPSGGSLVIDRTEAMTVVDVNTGKFTGSGGNLEETVTKNNLEAAEEVVRQLRLRDIGGIIVVDFIDMVLESNRDLVLRRMVECLGRDRTRHQVAEVTSLGLVQMTRKRIGTGLLETFGEDCDHCKGRGVIVHEHPIEPGSRNATASVGQGGGVGGNGGGGGGSDESRGRRSRGGRNRNRGVDSAPVEPTIPSPMALVGTKPHAESEIIADDPIVPEETVDIPLGTFAPTESDESTELTDLAEPTEPTEDAPEAIQEPDEVLVDETPVVEAPAPIVVTTTRRRRAGRPAGPAATPTAELTATIAEASDESKDEPGDVDQDVDQDGEPSEDGSGSVFHVPVKKKGSRKR